MKGLSNQAMAEVVQWKINAIEFVTIAYGDAETTLQQNNDALQKLTKALTEMIEKKLDDVDTEVVRSRLDDLKRSLENIESKIPTSSYTTLGQLSEKHSVDLGEFIRLQLSDSLLDYLIKYHYIFIQTSELYSDIFLTIIEC